MMNEDRPASQTRVSRADGPLAARPGLLRIGTRGSALAVAQSTTVAQAIAEATGYEVALVIVKTQGDTSTAPLSQLGGTGVFVSALRDALLAGECDLAVHSLKDLPTGDASGITLGAIPGRADARDALCAREGMALEDVRAGGLIGTGSPRRMAQILARRPDLQVQDIRGNVDTRLARITQDLDAVVLAAAGLDRIGRSAAITERFGLDVVPTAPGQGALAIEVRSTDADEPPYAAALAAIDDADSRATAFAERSLLTALEAGCAAPVGASATMSQGRLHLRAVVYRLDGGAQLEAADDIEWPESSATSVRDRDELAKSLGAAVAASLLYSGAAELAPLGGRA